MSRAVKHEEFAEVKRQYLEAQSAHINKRHKFFDDCEVEKKALEKQYGYKRSDALEDLLKTIPYLSHTTSQDNHQRDQFTYIKDGQPLVLTLGYNDSWSVNGNSLYTLNNAKQIIEATAVFQGGLFGVIEYLQKAHDILY